MKYLCLIAVLLVGSIACESPVKKEEILVMGIRLTNHTDCKTDFKGLSLNQAWPDSLSGIEYQYAEDSKTLLIKHINAGFNCCPGELTCVLTESGDTIIIAEAESAQDCRCNCLYDMDIEVNGCAKKNYVIKLVEPYVEGLPQILFDIDLKAAQEGTFYVVRKTYPWGVVSGMN